MKKFIIAAGVSFSLLTGVAKADQATLDALNAANVTLTPEQVAEVAAQSCTDDASCQALAELVAQIAASYEGNDQQVMAILAAFSQAHPAYAALAVERTMVLAPNTAVFLAAMLIELDPAATGVATLQPITVSLPQGSAGGGSSSPSSPN